MLPSNDTPSTTDPTVFEFGPLVLVLSPSGKVVLIAKNQTRHVTINLGGKSGILDIHLTDQGSTEVHEPLGGLRTTDLELLLRQVEPHFERGVEELISKLVQPVQFGWLGHHGIYVIPYMFHEQDLLKLGVRRGRRWSLSEAQLAAQYARPMSRKEVERSPSSAFALYKRVDRTWTLYGALFKVSRANGHVGFRWFQATDAFAEVGKLWRRHGAAVLSKVLSADEIAEAIGDSRIPQHG